MRLRLLHGGTDWREIYAELKRSCAMRVRMPVRNGFPRIPRRVSGFNLDELLPENGFHVARSLWLGSEGTCAIVLGATLRLVRSPQSSGRWWGLDLRISLPLPMRCRRIPDASGDWA